MPLINLLIKGKLKMIKLTASLILGSQLVLNPTFVLAAEESISSAKSHHVLIKSFEFIPKVLKVSIGDTVTWTNKDVVPHNVANITPFVKASKYLEKGDTYSLKITGSVYYKCGLHPSMKGRILLF